MSELVSEFPSQSVPESEKTIDWGKKHVEYAIHQFDNYRSRQISKISRLYNSYNGIVDTKDMHFLNSTYGAENIIKYIDYKLARPKIDLLNGEFISRPLNATVYTTNKEAVSKKLDDYQLQLGYKYAADDINKIKEVTGFDPMDGMPVPNKPDREIRNVKTQNEIISQKLLKYCINTYDVKHKLASNFLDVEIGAECGGKTYIDKMDGKVKYREIDPRDMLFEEIDRDIFLQRTPHIGERRIMFIHEILSEFELDEKEKESLRDGIKNRGSDTFNKGNRNYYHLINKNMAVEVFTIEWFSVLPFYTKISPDPNSIDGTPYRKSLSTEYYSANRNKIEKDVAAGKYKVETKYKKVVYEITKIGENIYKNFGIKKNMMGSIDNPFETMYSYTGLLFNTKDGIRVSLMETLDNISRVFNMVMFQITRELSKAKGKVIAYDRAYLPKDTTMKQVLYQMTNDGIYDYNSAEDGNISGQKVEVNGAIREIDLGVSNTMQTLLGLKVELQNMADRLSGVNENRQGQIAASSTAMNANSAIQASRTITEPMFFAFSKFTENVFLRIVEMSKVAYGILRPDLGELILGDEGVSFLRVTKDLAYDSYGVYIHDSGREMEIRQYARSLGEMSLNSKEIRLSDMLEFELQETLPEAIEVVKKGWKEVKDIASQQAQQNSEAQMQMQQQQLEIQTANREDAQQHMKDLEILRAQLQMNKGTMDAKNKFIQENAIQENDQMNNAGNEPLV